MMSPIAMQQVLEIIARDRVASGVSPDRLDVAAARASLPLSLLPLPTSTTVQEVVADGVKCFWVIAPGIDPNRRIAYLHGGGFVAGGLHSHRSLMGWLSKASGCAILAIEYSLAPEFKFPTQINEACRAWKWMLSHGPAGNSDARACFLSGDSAGAAIAVAVMLRAREEISPLPDAAAFFCPMLDLDAKTSAFVRSSQRMRELVDAYTRAPIDLSQALASPILATLDGMPPMLLQTGSADEARGDSERFAATAKTAGVDVNLAVWPDMFHVWQRFAPLLPEAAAALTQAGTFLGDHRV